MQRLFKSGGVHFPAYDLNGNVMGLVNATNGMIKNEFMFVWQFVSFTCLQLDMHVYTNFNSKRKLNW